MNKELLYRRCKSLLKLTLGVEPDCPLVQNWRVLQGKVSFRSFVRCHKIHGRPPEATNELRAETTRFLFRETEKLFLETPALITGFLLSGAYFLGVKLGLAIARSVVDAHLGRISAENNVGGGATFRIYLPVQCRENAESKSAWQTTFR
jgi:hypothetical protein